ncbi:unnamed protein product [Auanema sp. JU1783]|nr:unnamed protein product [Auanema sp. JU1783]
MIMKVVPLMRTAVRTSLFRTASLSKYNIRLCSSKNTKAPQDELEKELEKISEKLKKDFEGNLDENGVDKNFMNFKSMNERKAHQRSHIFNWKIALSTLLIGGSCLLALLYVRKMRLDEREKQRKLTAGKARIGGEWELVNTDGKVEGSEQLKGNWLLMYFGFTHCPDICPDEIEKMIKVVSILKEEKADPVPVQPVFISVDPTRDTVARVKQYCAEFSSELKGYTGDVEQVNKVAKTFRVYHSQGPKTTPDDYIVDHTVIMYLIDPDGNFHDYYGQNRTAEEIANVIKIKVLKHKLQSKKGIFNF